MMRREKQYMQCNDFLKSMLCAGGLMLTVQSDVVRAASSAGLEMDADITQVSCTLAFSQPTPLTLADVKSSALSGKGVTGITPVTLTMTSCGLGGGAVSPTVNLSGTHPDAAEAISGAGPWVFKDTSATNTSYRYFIVVGKNASPTFTGAGVYKEGEAVFRGEQGDSGTGKSTILYMGVTCVNDESCRTARAGSLTAKLTFTFAYK